MELTSLVAECGGRITGFSSWEVLLRHGRGYTKVLLTLYGTHLEGFVDGTKLSVRIREGKKLTSFWGPFRVAETGFTSDKREYVELLSEDVEVSEEWKGVRGCP